MKTCLLPLKYRFLALISGLALALGVNMQPAQAQMCTISAPNVNLGSIDSMLTSDINFPASITVNCRGLFQTQAYYCLMISNTYPVDMTAGGGTRRILWLDGQAGASAYSMLPFNFLTPDNKIWGAVPPSNVNFGTPLTGSVERDENAASFTVPFTVQAGGGHGLQINAGNYSNIYNITFYINYINHSVSDGYSLCQDSTRPDWTMTFNQSLTVTATAKPACTIQVTGAVDFGKTFSAANIAPAQGQIQVGCGGYTSYSIGISPGNYAENGRRAMQCAESDKCGQAKVYYDLYQDSAYSTVWNDKWGTPNVVSDSFPFNGGSNKTYTVYAKVYPGQGSAPTGAYRDIVTVTVQPAPAF